MTLRRQLVALCLTALGCESIAPRTTPDAAVDAGAVVDVPDAPASDIVDAPDVQTTDAPDVQTADIVDAPAADAPDVVTGDIVDAPFVDAPDVATEDVVDATTVDTPDVVTADIVDASIADAPDVVTADVVDASVNPFPSTGADGPFPGSRVPNDAGVIELEARVWNFTTITVSAGTTVRAAQGAGVLDLRATDDVLIAGTVDLSGGRGGTALNGSVQTGPGYGGDTATATIRPQGADTSSTPSTAGGRGGVGSPGEDVSCPTLTPPTIARGGVYGGGSGGRSGGSSVGCLGGAGGGGFAGGAGGGPRGGRGASDRLDLGGSPRAGGPAEGGQPDLIGGPLAVYAGGAAEMTTCIHSGGGGSIGESAARDLSVRTTFRPGSGGGGGSGAYYNGAYGQSGGGGGGGGGALRVASPTSILVSASGVIRVDGGGGGGGAGNVGAGGGGSGGVLYLAAPSIAVRGTLSARGGSGQTLCARSGNGGFGRIRLSVDPMQCDILGTSMPSIPTGCAPSPDGGVPGQAYVGAWPN